MVLLCLVLIFGCGGCANSSAFIRDRKNDAFDVFTVSVGKGFGAKGRVGPLHVGLLVNHDYAGLRGGQYSRHWGDYVGGDIDTLIIPFWAYGFGMDDFGPDSVISAGRNKEYLAWSHYVPFIYMFEKPRGTHGETVLALSRSELHPFTQIEGVVGVGITIRAGVNIGEIIDAILGWVGVDLYDDDIEEKKLLVTSPQKTK